MPGFLERRDHSDSLTAGEQTPALTRAWIAQPCSAQLTLPRQVLRSMTTFQREPRPGSSHPPAAGQAAFGKGPGRLPPREDAPLPPAPRTFRPAAAATGEAGWEKWGWATHHLWGGCGGPGRKGLGALPLSERDSLCFEPTLTGTLSSSVVLSCLGPLLPPAPSPNLGELF